MSATGFIGVVLAGGKSSRMGQDKRFLELDGCTLLQRTVNLLHSAGAEEILISGDYGSGAIPDLLPGLGPPGALHAVLSHLQQRQQLDSQLLLLLPVDMPLLNASTLGLLLAQASSARAVRFQDEVFPCVIRASSELLAHLQTLLKPGAVAGGQRSMKAILAMQQAKALAVLPSQRQQLLNVNTPAEWQALAHLPVDSG